MAFLGEVTRINDPSDFWLRYYGSDKDVESFRQFEESMNVTFMQLPLAKLEEITENDCILVQCPVVVIGSSGSPHATSSRQWRRANVIRVDRSKNAIDVFYCDYGITEIVASNRVSRELPETANALPITCARCCLAGIRPIARSWTSRGIKTFEKLTVEVVQMAFLSFDQPSLCYKVALYSRDRNGKSITHQLLEAETGLPTDEKVEEFAKDVQPVCFTSFNKDFFCNDDYDSNVVKEEENMDDDDEDKEDGEEEKTDDDDEDKEDVEEDEDAIAGEDAAASYVRADGIVVPSFNLSVLQQHRGLSAEELQRHKESALQAARRAELQKDMITCHKEMETFVLPGSGQHWGNSDLLIGRQLSADVESEAVDKSALTETASFMTTSRIEMTINPAQATNDVQVVDRAEQPDVAREEVAVAVKDEFLDEMSPLDKSQQMSNREHSPSPPPECMTQEERNYYLQKKLSCILHDAFDGEEQDITLSKFYSLVPHEAINRESSVNLLLEVLIDEASKNEEITELALHVMEAYSDVITELELEGVLKQARDRFIKLPIGKLHRYHAGFSNLLVRLLHQSSVWPPLIKTVVQDLCFNCLEKWIIFNKRGAQSGLVHRHLEKMYVECLEIVLPQCLSTLELLDAERVQFFTDELREKVLETEVDYSIRSRLLSLLLSVLTRGPEEPTLSTRRVSTRCRGVQCEEQPSPSQHPPSTARGPGIDICLQAGPSPRTCVQKDAGVQTEAARKEGDVRRGSWSSMDSFDRTDASSAGCSRSRRKLAVMEHLQKTVTNPSRRYPSTPDCGPSPVDLSPCPAFPGSSVDLMECSGPAKPAMGDAGQTGPVTVRQEITDQSCNPVQRTNSSCVPAEAPVDWFWQPPAPSSLVSDGSSLAVEEQTLFSDQGMDSAAAEGASKLSLATETVLPPEEGTNVDRSGIAQSETPSSGRLQNKSFFSAVTSISQSAWNSVFGGPLRRVSFGPKAEAAGQSAIVPAMDFLSDSLSTTSSSGMILIVDAESEANIAAESFAEEALESCSSGSDIPVNWEELASPTDSPPPEPLGSGVCNLIDSPPPAAEGSSVCNPSDLQSRNSSIADDQCAWINAQDVKTTDEKTFELDNVNACMINQKDCTDSVVQNTHLKEKNLVSGSKLWKADSGQSAITDRFETGTTLLLPLPGRATNPSPLTQLVTNTPPPLTQLSLRCIASGLLHCDLQASSDESAHSLLEKSGEEQSRVNNSMPGQDQAAAPCDTTQDDEIYISEDEKADSIPSDWEDRVSPFPEEFGSEKWQYMEKGETQWGRSSAKSRPHIVNDSGDGESWQRGAAMTPAVMTSSPLKDEVGQDYSQGDLGFMAKERKRGKKRTTFRPWDEQKFPATKPPSESRGAWVPSVKCTNCQAPDHLRNECPKPRKHILFAANDPIVY